VWVVCLEPSEGGFVVTQVTDLSGDKVYEYYATPYISVPASADIKDEICAYMYAHRILENLQLDTTKD
jgi:hypothetical protein